MNNTIQIHGSNSGQVALSESGSISQTSNVYYSAPPSPEELNQARKELERLVEELKGKIPTELDGEKEKAALDHANELKETLLSQKPELDTIGYVKTWFIKNVPRLAGDISGLIIHPIVGKLVEAGGELLASEFRRRFISENQ